MFYLKLKILIPLGFTPTQLTSIAANSKGKGTQSLLSVSKNCIPLFKLGYSKEDITNLASSNQGHNKIEAAVKYANALKTPGICTLIDIIKILSPLNGASMLKEKFEELYKPFNAEALLQHGVFSVIPKEIETVSVLLSMKNN